MLWQRVLSAVVLIPLAVGVIHYGGWPLIVVIALLIGLAQWEMNKMLDRLGVKTIPLLGLFGAGLFLLGAVCSLQDSGLALSMSLLIWLCLTVFRFPGFTITDAGVNFLGTVYCGWLFSLLYLLRSTGPTAGFFFLMFVLVCNWGSDTFAYFSGMALGRHRLAPLVSPKKSIEGAIGGVLGATVVAYVLARWAPYGSLPRYVLLGALISIVGQLGDLAESSLKRQAGVKDSGNLIPGHGGVLDRFDSVLATAPLAYYYITLLIMS